jgi:exopolyphosphatase / guanosine-5'-triphosphate,3'-diphosphate pyrophosphatase
MIFGAIDIGTNAARLLIGEVVEENGNSYVKKISYNRVPLRLGFEVFSDGLISDAKTEHFIKTIQAFKLISEVYGVKELRACATSAMREATNGKKVQKRIRKETGVNIEIIDGEEEANIIFSTFLLIAFDKTVPFIVVDVGGGSTEISVFEKGSKIAGKSFQVGTIRILKNKVADSLWQDMGKWLTVNVDLTTPHKVFATGGNINKLHKLLDKELIDPILVQELKELHKVMQPMTVEERILKYQFKEDRADVIVPACEIYLFIAKYLACNEYFVPKIGLSDGMIYNLHQKQLK